MISLQSKGLSRVFSSITVRKDQFFNAYPSLWSNTHNKHDNRKTRSSECIDLCWQSDVFAFEYTVWFVVAFLPRRKDLLISWLQSPSAVILEPPKIKSAAVFTVSPSICREVMGPGAMIFVFWMLSFKPTFHSALSLSSRGSLVLLHFLP